MCYRRTRRPRSLVIRVLLGHPAALATLLVLSCNQQAEPQSSRLGGGPNLGANKSEGPTLHSAAESGNLERVTELLAQHAVVDDQDGEGRTPLHLAAEAGHALVVKLLLDRGAEANAKDADGNTPLELVRKAMAAHWKSGKTIPQSYVQIGEDLAFAGATVQGRKLKDTMMHRYAFAYGKEEARRLLEKGANVNGLNEEGETPLHMAAFAGAIDRVELFLEYGANLQAIDSYGRTPLHGAAGQGKLETVKTLLAWGSDPKATDQAGRTPLHEVAQGSSPCSWLSRSTTTLGLQDYFLRPELMRPHEIRAVPLLCTGVRQVPIKMFLRY